MQKVQVALNVMHPPEFLETIPSDDFDNDVLVS